MCTRGGSGSHREISGKDLAPEGMKGGFSDPAFASCTGTTGDTLRPDIFGRCGGAVGMSAGGANILDPEGVGVPP